MQNKPATTAIPIHEIISKRWSPRAFDSSREVTDSDLHRLLEAARWAPSCFNEQPWRYIVCVKSKGEARWQAALESLAEKNQLWAINAPVLIVAVAMNNFSHNGNANPWATYDTGAASVSLTLQAAALGLVVHQMGGFSSEQVRDVFALPEDGTPMAVLAVGYQADVDILNDSFREAELSARSRLPLTEIVYSGRWGVGIEV